MQTTPTHWIDQRTWPTKAHAPPIDEPMRSLLRHRLADLERRLLDMSQTMDMLLRENAGNGGAGRDASEARSRTEAVALSEVRAARARFEAGSYGLCATCDAPIEPERLASRPQVLRCRFCEQQAEGPAERQVAQFRGALPWG